MKAGKQSGVVAVEFALIIGPMLIALFGITELGRALYQYNALVKATRSAARYLAQQDLAILSPADRTVIYNQTVSLAVCGHYSCAGKQPLAPGLGTDQVSLCDYETVACAYRGVDPLVGTLDLVSVTIGGPAHPFTFKSLIPWVVPDISFSAIEMTMAGPYRSP